MKLKQRCFLQHSFLAAALNGAMAVSAPAQVDPLDYVTVRQITDNNPLTSEWGRDRVSINSTSFKNESIVTSGDYQFTTYYRDDGKLLVARRDLTASENVWEIRATEFTSFNINDAHNVPVLGLDGDGYLHLAWGTHGNPLLYTRSATPVTGGQALRFVGDTVGNDDALNTMTGVHETATTYPNFIRIPGTGDLLFNYRTGGSGNGTYRITRYDSATGTWTWADQTWIANTDASGLTYNAYPHNMSYDSQGGLHASWTYRYNSSSPTGNSGFQTNHNLFYAFSPDDGGTWYKDPLGTIPYPADIDESNSQVIVNIPEGSSLINTGTQAIDSHDRPAIATWWAPRANDATPDHRRQYMYVGHDGTNWFTSQITHRRSDPNSPVPESNLGANHMGRPQILLDDYNRAYVIYKDQDNGGGVTVAVSQAESRDDWEFIELTAQNLGHYEPTVDRALWDSSRQLHILVQTIDGNSGNGGSPMEMVQWDAASAMGRVLRWTGQDTSVWDSSAVNFSDLGTPDDFDSFDHVTFDDSGIQKAVDLVGNVEAGKVVVDTTDHYRFSGPGSLTHGSLAVVGGGSLELATSGNSYAGPTRVSNATLKITGDTNAMTSKMVIADGGTLIMDPSDASTMASRFEVWPTGRLEIGVPESTGNVFPDHPAAVLNDGLIRVNVTETLRNMSGMGTVEAAAGTTTLRDNPEFEGHVRIVPGATVISASEDGLGSGRHGQVVVEHGGKLRLEASSTLRHDFDVSSDDGFGAAVEIAPAAEVTLAGNVAIQSPSTVWDTGADALATFTGAITGVGSLAKQGGGRLRLKGENTYTGRTVVRDGVLMVEQATGYGETIVDPGGVLEARGSVRGDLQALGGGTVRVASSLGSLNGLVYRHDFDGALTDLDGMPADVAPGAELWVASTGFNADGSLDQTVGGSATLPFTPTDGEIYTLDVSLAGVNGNQNWIALGFANGQSSASSGDDRFITGNVIGAAWMLVRGSAASANNQAFRGLDSGPNAGTTDGVSWTGPLANASPGGDIDMRIVLDTTGGPGNWTVTWLARRPADSEYHEVRPSTPLLTETIDSVGLALANAGVYGSIEAFSLTADIPGQDPREARMLTVAGDFTLHPDAILEMQLESPGNHDFLKVLGRFHAAGTLVVSLQPGAPSVSVGDQFHLLDFGALSGVFQSLVLPEIGPDVAWDSSLLMSHGILRVIAGMPGDFTGDGLWNLADLDALTAAIATQSTDLSFDMNGDGLVNLADVTGAGTGWLTVGGANNRAITGGHPFLAGDADLNGDVDVSDFNRWNSHKFTSTNAWSQGDLNADGFVDVSDFNIWNGHKFTSAIADAAAVPDPASGLWLAWTGLSLFLNRRFFPPPCSTRRSCSRSTQFVDT